LGIRVRQLLFDVLQGDYQSLICLFANSILCLQKLDFSCSLGSGLFDLVQLLLQLMGGHGQSVTCMSIDDVLPFLITHLD